jgi:hypothetical protein
MRKLLFILVPLVVIAVVSCQKLPTYPDVPVLEYKSVTFGEGDLGKTFTLTVSFTDGDGDVGYEDAHHDPLLFITLSYFINNEWRDTSINFNTSTPYLTPDGPHKALKASIDKTDDLPFFPPPVYESPTRIRFTAYMYDRAMHRSNTIVTPEFLVDNP